MVKEFLDKLGLEELIKLIVSLDSEGEAIKIEKKDHHKILSVKFDGETIKLNSEGELTLPLDFETIYLSSEGLLKAKPEELDDGIATEVYYNSEGHETVNVLFDDKMIILDSEGKLRTRIGGWLEAGTASEVIHYVDNKFIKVDNDTIFVNSEGALEATFQRHTADEPIEIDSEGKITFNYDGSTLVLDSEGTLNVPIDGVTIVIDSEGFIAVNIDNDTIILDSEGRLCSGSVYPDERTIIKDANKIISVPIDDDTIIVTSEGLVISPRGYINGVELKGDHNTEEAKITWWGTVAEYEALKAAGLLNEYTLYVINTSEGYIPSTPNYDSLINKPQINHVELSGDKKLSEFGIQPTLTPGTAMDLSNNTLNLKYHAGVLAVNTSNELFANTYSVDQINNMVGSMRTIKVVSVLPIVPAINTLYYVETSVASVYDVYLYDSDRTQIPLGKSTVGTYSAGTSIEIDTFSVISVKRDTEISSTGSDVPTTLAVYNFLFEGATATANGERGLVPEPSAGDEHKLLAGNATWVDTFGAASSLSAGYSGPVPAPAIGDERSVLRGDATWVTIVDDCITDADDKPLSAAQGKYLEDRLGTDEDWLAVPLNTYVQEGNVYYKKKNNVVTIRLDEVKLKTPLNLEIGTLPTEVIPDCLLVTTTIALNNNNAQAAFTVDDNGALKLYSKTGQYAYSGTITYTV